MKKWMWAFALASLGLTLAACSSGVGGKNGELTAKRKSARSGATPATVTSAMLLGSLEYPQSTDTAAYTGTPEFLAFKFGANAGDSVDIRVKSADGGDAVAWVLDDDFATLTWNDDASYWTLDSHVKWTAKAGETFTHYLVIRDYWERPATFTVSFAGTKAKTADFYSCNVDSGCAKVPDIACGGFTANAHECPANYRRAHSSTPDVPGKCVETCGGIVGRQCSDSTQKCVYDDPNCNPANGGADCTGTCKSCTPTNCGINGHGLK